ncbi:MAG: tRNA uridine-5-carboxymethylaminomethyl(34) synthesis enzyme MnmG [Myxococcaceae bacterium]|nr:tRNA uridine-5-carboxymethylaminomethyl(34) synthesis enzyme MnmG [Myxococcaceae bacterium]MBH2005967.1 tRNA uridine-5-carboxymethylaminomethyl(34) synthesis enzyme MnmG [Myxococcaceae bacterium]
MAMKLDVIVVGAGHAGCEAALSAARLGLKTLLITGSLDRMAALSCNPAIGGVGKGHLVKEIDALGGEMARIADRTGIHFRTLNASRGPAVQATRCQSDMERYRRRMTEVLFATPNLHLKQDDVLGILTEKGRVQGVSTKNSGSLLASAVVITTGTFMGAQLHLGFQRMPGGRAGEAPTSGLSASLADLGFELGRLKTGTCPRLDARTIDYAALEEQKPDHPAPLFSFESREPVLRQISCHLTYTNPKTHEVIGESIRSNRAPLYNGQIAGTGPRYCPSIEDKVVRFAEKESHLIFLEPQGLDTYEVYPNGLSTSLPPDVQIEFLRTVQGLERVEVTRWGYAVEYDFVKPTQLFSTLETKCISGLYCAGQINGTTGYEEAAAQGLLAGLNASLKLLGKEPIVLGRHQAYAGVLIDDLVTLGTDEPYRMFTSRAEHRLVLREDNVYERLALLGHQAGLLSSERFESIQAFEDMARSSLALEHEDPRVRHRARVEQKYAGYIGRVQKELREQMDLDACLIPESVFDSQIPGMSNEVFEKLKKHRPQTLGQAARLSGITPAAQTLIRVAIKRHARSQESYA